MQSKGGERGAGKGRRQTQRQGRWTECWQARLPGLIQSTSSGWLRVNELGLAATKKKKGDAAVLGSECGPHRALTDLQQSWERNEVKCTPRANADLRELWVHSRRVRAGTLGGTL